MYSSYRTKHYKSTDSMWLSRRRFITNIMEPHEFTATSPAIILLFLYHTSSLIRKHETPKKNWKSNDLFKTTRSPNSVRSTVQSVNNTFTMTVSMINSNSGYCFLYYFEPKYQHFVNIFLKYIPITLNLIFKIFLGIHVPANSNVVSTKSEQ